MEWMSYFDFSQLFFTLNWLFSLFTFFYQWIGCLLINVRYHNLDFH